MCMYVWHVEVGRFHLGEEQINSLSSYAISQDTTYYTIGSVNFKPTRPNST